ncbi:unnamed protein product, partial [Mesorhabditis belari]|uniref:Uncharacterized protein n=1 Tax=Mesorhabditis belari TaxID=2138241 RepID=A0AAF3JAW6_9BILA
MKALLAIVRDRSPSKTRKKEKDGKRNELRIFRSSRFFSKDDLSINKKAKEVENEESSTRREFIVPLRKTKSKEQCVETVRLGPLTLKRRPKSLFVGYDPNSLKRRIKNEDGDVEGVDSNGNFESSWDFDEKPTSVREKIADFERRSSIDSDQGSCISISLKTPKNRIYPFETLKIDPILQNTHLLDEKFAEIRKIFGPNEQIGVYLNLDVQEDLMSRRNSRRKSLIKSPSLLSEPQFNADPTSDEYLTPEEDEELIRTGEPRTQSIVVKGKREHETFAVANLEAPVHARETVNKTIVVGVKQKSLLVERISANIALPTQKSNEKLIEKEEKEGVTGETTELVEQQLREIGRLAENIANAVTKHSQKNRDSEVMSTSASSSFIRLDNIDEEMGRSQASASLHKCASTPRVFSIDNAVEIQPNPVKRVFPVIGIEAGAMVDKLSRGLADLTSGSQDRLQRWKNKLQTTARRHKDASEPPPMHRNCFPKLTSKEEPDKKIAWAMSGGSHSIPAPRPLHSSKSLNNAGTIIHGQSLNTQLSLDMEHRTLKSRENSASQKNIFSYEQYDNVYNGKPPGPARLPPISGVRPDGTDLVRPIAFRPVPSVNDAVKRQSAGAFRSDFERSRTGPLSSSLNGTPPIPTSAVPSAKPKGIHQPSTSFSQFPHQRASMENEYDTVNEFYEKNDAGSNGSDYSGGAGSLGRKIGQQNGHVSSPGSTNKKSFTSSTSSSVSRHSSGVHVTPSPSDSGIVDYESIIRDKENELREVRNTMEQNEEIIIKVYQEKERNYKNEITALRARLAASEKGENALRAQLTSCQRQTESMRITVEGLMAEKRELERRCAQLERDVAQLKGQKCADCKRLNGNHPVSPRIAKETTPNEELRDEVSQLRREVATLRDALGSVTMFNNNHTASNINRTPSEPKIPSGRDRLI